MDIDFAHETRMYLGLYEIELNRHLKRICMTGITSFDVGGQQGFDALVFAKLTNAPVITFERDERLIKRLPRIIGLNPSLAPLIEPIHATVGIGGATGTLSLDEYAAAQSFVPDFIKIDVEGAEVDVLYGASSILHERGPALVVEVHSLALERECGRILVQHGYSPIVVSQRGFWPDNRPAIHNRWLVAHEPSR